MNDRDTDSIAAPQQPRRWYRRKRFWLLGFLAAIAIWHFVPSTYSGAGIRFSLYSSGTPGSLTFVIRDSLGAPLPGVTVMSESLSGTTEELTTDATGVAIIRPGESEVLAVRIARREFRFCPRDSSFPELFAPDCSLFGLTFHVVMGTNQKPSFSNAKDRSPSATARPVAPVRSWSRVVLRME